MFHSLFVHSVRTAGIIVERSALWDTVCSAVMNALSALVRPEGDESFSARVSDVWESDGGAAETLRYITLPRDGRTCVSP